ncbi:OmpW family protein [Burkholderia sp. Nafp2/4-1b]|uniref:OmpW/AlkL family protein n=1 Tax=Burkholderia sp. Nafp2/4-1b TaxID=2116686 RepID=UPI000EF94252|nr:OmpW family outer membrane protein [Burkholderia sp. Nafp2/4-1b]RKU03539.1 OmpW family protein [Burkholderia sp. Nafp2/4-1b]
MNRISAGLAIFVATISAAHAQSAGQWVVNAGWSHFAPQGSAEPLTVNALGQSQVMTGSSGKISSGDTLGLTATYFVTDHIAATTVMGIPPTWHLTGAGTLSSVGELGTARAWSPALIFNYYFGQPNARFRPYLGAGVTYTWFSNIKLSSPVSTGQIYASPTVGTALEGPTTVSLSKSFAPVINGGLTYNIDSHWSINASVAYSWVSTRATLTTKSSVGTVTSTSKFKVDPIVTFLSVGYRF